MKQESMNTETDANTGDDLVIHIRYSEEIPNVLQLNTNLEFFLIQQSVVSLQVHVLLFLVAELSFC